MERYRFKNKSKSAGMTLIEVLIALAIIAIALTAIVKATTENIRSTSYLQHKTLALWVAEDILNKARTGVITLSGDNDSNDNVVTILGEDWHWKGKSDSSANPHIKKINIDVYASDNDDASPVISLESYVYAQ